MSQFQSSPFVNFQGRAREAMERYQQILGGTVDLLAVDEKGAAKPAGPGDAIRFARLQAGDTRILGTDGHPDYPAQVGSHMAIALTGTDRDRLAKVLDELAEGGRVQGPLAPLPWGGEAGWIVDKFGVTWMIAVAKA